MVKKQQMRWNRFTVQPFLTSNCSIRYCTFSRTSCCAVAAFRFLLSEAVLWAMPLVEPLLAVNALLLLLYIPLFLPLFCPGGAIFSFTLERSEGKIVPTGRQERT